MKSRQFHLRPFISAVVAFAGFLLFYAETSGIIMRINVAQGILRGGVTSFVCAVNPATGVVTGAHTSDVPLLQT